jgi:hypothetical protein
MIIATYPGIPIELTGKNTPRRNVTVAAYTDVIERAYNAAEESSAIGADAPQVWTSESTYTFVQMVIHAVLERAVGDEEDIFQVGCNRQVHSITGTAIS